MERTETNIAHLLKLVEKKIKRGQSDLWNGYDFDWLSDSVYQETGVKISSLTLKRVWGKVHYNSKPSISTLNALSQYVGFADFRASHAQPNTKEEKKSPISIVSKTKSKFFPKLIYLFIGMAILLTTFSYLYKQQSAKSIIFNKEDLKFNIAKVDSTLPTSVIFRYDARVANNEDKIEIQQNWDSRRREKVSKLDSVHTSLYYYPGFYETKLVVNDSIMQEQPLLITSNGWVAAIERKPVPLYLEPFQYRNGDTIAVTKKTVEAYGIIPETEEIWTIFNYVKEFEKLRADNFSLKTRIKNEPLGGVNICQKLEILVLMKGNAIIIPFAKKGCVADLNIYTPENIISGRNNDLSNFGIDLSDWNEVALQSKNNQLSVILNQQTIYKTAMKATNPIIGVRIRFQGAGQLENVLLQNAHNQFKLD